MRFKGNIKNWALEILNTLIVIYNTFKCFEDNIKWYQKKSLANVDGPPLPREKQKLESAIFDP